MPCASLTLRNKTKAMVCRRFEVSGCFLVNKLSVCSYADVRLLFSVLLLILVVLVFEL